MWQSIVTSPVTTSRRETVDGDIVGDPNLESILPELRTGGERLLGLVLNPSGTFTV